MRRFSRWAAAALTATVFAGLWQGTARADEPSLVRIGLVASLFRDQPESLIVALMKPFGALVEAQTGLRGQLVTGGQATELGKLLESDKVQLAVFHGVEFGWARQKYPALRPLVVAINQEPYLRALLVVRQDNPARTWQDLSGRTLAMPRGSRDHCHLYLEHCCRCAGRTPAKLFKCRTTPPNSEEALDDVVDREADAVVVDELAFESFQHRKPGRASALKVLARSAVFPAAVVAYHPGALTDEQLAHFRNGMLSANQSALGRQLMTLWKLTAFIDVPHDYEETLKGILKIYPTCPAGK